MLMYKQYCFLCDQIYFGYISLSFSHLLKEKGCGIEMPKINENDPFNVIFQGNFWSYVIYNLLEVYLVLMEKKIHPLLK